MDIGSSHIKLVVLEKKGKERILKKFSSQSLTPGDDLAAAIKKFIEVQDILEPCVNISISGPVVMMRYVSLPKMTLQELKSTMQFEAKQYIPFSLDEMILDCAIVKEKLDNNKMLVVFAAIKKTAAQERISLIEKAGLTLGIIDVDCFCLVNAFTHNLSLSAHASSDAKLQAVGLLNIGARSTNMAIIENGSLCFSRDIAYGGQEATLNNLGTEINSSIDYYENQNGKPVEKIYLSGGLSLDARLYDFLARLLNMQVCPFDVFSGITMGPSIAASTLKAQGSMFAISLGLALR